MDTTQPTFFNWSSGKDAALALYHLQQNPRYDVRQLLTSVNTHYKRVSMHGLRQSLLERQTAAIGLPSRLLQLPEQPTMEEYNKIMTKELSVLRDAGYTHSGFGDIFLQDLRTY
ncbi:MAG: ATP-binding protein, partial [Bacteroidota bacterium]